MMNSESASMFPANGNPLLADELTRGELVGKEVWIPFASFVIEFQVQVLDNHAQKKRTKVHHIEADTCATWPDLALTAVCQWLVVQLPFDL